MIERALDFIKQHKAVIQDHSKYILETDWTLDKRRKDRIEEFDVQVQILNSLLDKMEYVCKQAEDEVVTNTIVKKFVKGLLKVFLGHEERSSKYFTTEKWQDYGTDESLPPFTERQDEVKFQSTVLKKLIEYNEKISKLNINREVKEVELPIHSEKIAPLPYHNIVARKFDKVNELVQKKFGDILVPKPKGIFSGSTELLINMNPKDIPKYEQSKHYFEQEKSTIEFYMEEWSKMTRGVNLNGYKLHPWLYYHLNYFHTFIPQEDKTEKLMLPPLRDNEFYFIENYERAELDNKGLLMFGSRRFSKSTIIASYLSWIALTKENGKSEVIGGSSADLKQLTGFIKTAMINMHPAFNLPTNTNDWDKHIKLGLKNKGNTEIPYSEIMIKNAEDGQAKASEKGAGGAPVGFIIDEIGKFACEKFYTGALPAFKTIHGMKLVPILTGTSGNAELSADAYKMVQNPEMYSLLPMDWDTLENRIPDKADITWKRRKFGIFVPAQMSYEEGLAKKTTTLDKYLGIENNELLHKINIQVTDWKNSKTVLNNILAQLKADPDRVTRQKMYYPQDPDWCFGGNADNPFPVQEAHAVKQKLIEEGNIGRNVDLFAKPGTTCVGYTTSNKERAHYPFRGGIHDAPVILFDEPPSEKPAYGEFVSGLDSYKQNEAGTESLGTLYVLKRKTDIKTPIELIQASVATRPSTMKMFNRTAEMMIEGWNAECLLENADTSFIQYLDERNKVELLLADGVDWSQSVNKNSKPSNRFGYYPTPKNKMYCLSLAINYTREQVEVGVDEEGNIQYKMGIEFIPDIDLLDEFINFTYGGNFDRIIAFGAALAWARWLDKMHVQPQKSSKELDEQRKKKREEARKALKGFGLVKNK